MLSATVTPSSLRRPRRDRTKTARQRPTLTGVHISSTYDALCVLNGVRLGLLKPVERRLDPDEREDIQSGYVYVYEESHGSKARQGIERWTDGKRWSASRSKENFLFYEENSAGSEDADGPELDTSPASDDPNVALIDYMTASDAPGRLTKMTFSSWVKLPGDPPDLKRKWLLVCYWQKPHVKTLPKAYELEILLDLDIPRGMFFSSRAGKNKQQGLPAAGTAYDAVLRRPTDLEALRWRKAQYYANGGRAPLPVGPGTRPEDAPDQYAGRGAWVPVEQPIPGPSLTDARFRYHDQHQRTFPHHRTRRDELEDIPITERPPHWRPNAGQGNQANGNAIASMATSSSSSSVAGPRSPSYGESGNRERARESSPPSRYSERDRYVSSAQAPRALPPPSTFTSWPPPSDWRPMHAISSVRDQPPIPRSAGHLPPPSSATVGPLTPGSDASPLPSSSYPYPRAGPPSDYYARGSAPPTPPYANMPQAHPTRSIRELALAPSPSPAERTLPPLSASLRGWPSNRTDYDGNVIMGFDRAFGTRGVGTQSTLPHVQGLRL